MKKITTAFALGTILIGTFFPTIRIIAETTDVSNSSPVTELLNPLVKDATDIGAGNIGTSSWNIDTNGVLHIGAGDFGGRSPGGSGLSPWNSYKDDITSIVLEGKVTNSGGKYNNLFSDLSNVTNITGIEFLDTTGVTSIRGLFAGMSNLQGTLDLSAFDTSNVTDMNGLFLSDSLLSGVNVSSFDTSNVIDMGGMFSGMSSLQSLDLSSFDTSKITGNIYFLSGTSKLSQLTVGLKFDFGDSAMLPEISPNATYTGNWQNIGSGSLDVPSGSNIWTSSLFMSNYKGMTDADTYVWQQKNNPIAGGDVTAKYVDTDGNKISDDAVKSGNVGDAYTTEQKTIDGYTFKEVQGSATGTFTDQVQTVTYVYTKDPIAGGDVTAKYVDTDGNKISDDVVKSGNVGDAYTTEQKTIDGYIFKEVQGSATGTFTDQVQTVTYVYTKDPIAGGDVTAKYVDTDGNKISDDVVKSGNIGDAYTTEQKTIDGYTFKEVQGSATGTFTDQVQTVTYVYTKDPIAGGDVTAKYVDTDGNKISDDVVKSGNVGDAYTTEQKTIDGYTFKEVQGSATGTFTDQVQTVTYVYMKNNVTPSPKPDDHSDTPESSKGNGNKNDSTSENKSTLPQTGDNDGLSMIEMISGLFLVFGTIVMILFKRKRQD
ncbi:MucBP domain-containing protein [Lactococcus lactis]|uniref:MucBP domain-containing protein n=1 Tax=Lactococcus lactis TaxID=1358 RepID=UPI003877B3FE